MKKQFPAFDTRSITDSCSLKSFQTMRIWVFELEQKNVDENRKLLYLVGQKWSLCICESISDVFQILMAVIKWP